MDFTCAFESAETRFGVAGPLLVTLYRGSTTLKTLDALDRTQEALLQRFPTISTLSIIRQGPALSRTDQAVRARSIELGKKYQRQVTGSAIVVVSRGLGAVMVRTFLSGFFLLFRSEMPMKTFSTVAEGLSWLSELPNQDPLLRQISCLEVERFVE